MNPGPESSSPVAFVDAGANVYFAATDGATGFELWALPRATVEDALDFFTVAPCRAFDSRGGARLLSGVVRTLAVAGACGIPVSARAVVGNLTVVEPDGQGFLSVYPSGGARPPTSTVNINPGRTRTNNALLTLAGGNADALLDLAGGAGADLVLDVFGYFE